MEWRHSSGSLIVWPVCSRVSLCHLSHVHAQSRHISWTSKAYRYLKLPRLLEPLLNKRDGQEFKYTLSFAQIAYVRYQAQWTRGFRFSWKICENHYAWHGLRDKHERRSRKLTSRTEDNFQSHLKSTIEHPWQTNESRREAISKHDIYTKDNLKVMGVRVADNRWTLATNREKSCTCHRDKSILLGLWVIPDHKRVVHPQKRFTCVEIRSKAAHISSSTSRHHIS